MIESTDELVDRVGAMAVDFAAAVDLIQGDLETDTQTPQQVENLRASMTGILEDYRGIRTDLDNTDTVQLLQTQQNAGRILQMWTWERETRKAVQDFAGGVVETARVARGLNAGSDRSTYTVRAGETLQSIAQAELGDFSAWPRILDANPGLLPGELTSGSVLIIPEKR